MKYRQTIDDKKEKLHKTLYPDQDETEDFDDTVGTSAIFNLYASEALPLTSSTLVEHCASQELIPSKFNLWISKNPFHAYMFDHIEYYTDAHGMPNYAAALYVAIDENLFPAIIGGRTMATFLTLRQLETISLIDDNGKLQQYYTDYIKPHKKIGVSGIPIFTLQDPVQVPEPILVDEYKSALKEVQDVFASDDPVDRLSKLFRLRASHAFTLAGIDKKDLEK